MLSCVCVCVCVRGGGGAVAVKSHGFGLPTSDRCCLYAQTSRRYPHDGAVYGAAWSAFEKNMFASACHDGAVRVFDLVRTWDHVRTVRLTVLCLKRTCGESFGAYQPLRSEVPTALTLRLLDSRWLLQMDCESRGLARPLSRCLVVSSFSRCLLPVRHSEDIAALLDSSPLSHRPNRAIQCPSGHFWAIGSVHSIWCGRP
jgi:hypothetical protein